MILVDYCLLINIEWSQKDNKAKYLRFKSTSRMSICLYNFLLQMFLNICVMINSHMRSLVN